MARRVNWQIDDEVAKKIRLEAAELDISQNAVAERLLRKGLSGEPIETSQDELLEKEEKMLLSFTDLLMGGNFDDRQGFMLLEFADKIFPSDKVEQLREFFEQLNADPAVEEEG